MTLIDSAKRVVTAYVPALLGTMILLAVLAANGQPTVFPDTQEYYGAANHIYHDLAHRDRVGETININGDVVTKAYATNPRTIAYKSGRIMSRPIFYGLLMYPLHKLGTLWLLAAVQAGAAAYIVLVLWRAALPKAPVSNYLALMAILAVGTPLTFFAGFAMPDVFAFLGLVAAACSLFYWGRLTVLDRVGVWIVLTASIMFHTSHLVSGLAMLILGVVLLVVEGLPFVGAMKRTIPLAAALVTAVSCNMIYNMSWQAERGYRPLRPPFLAARVLADGTGRDYLRKSCGEGASWALCAYKNQPLLDNHHILFSKDPGFGVAYLADVETLEKIDREELKFVVAAVANQPFRQVLVSLKNTALQLIRFGPGEPLSSPFNMLNNPRASRSILPRLVPNAEHCRKFDCRPRVAVEIWWAIDIMVMGLAAGFLAWRLSAADVLPRRFGLPCELAKADRNLVGAALFLALAVVVNAGVCGALSAPAHRYQARVVALAPMAAWLVASSLGLRRRRRAGENVGDAALAPGLAVEARA